MIDIFNPQISVVARGIEGKTILLYGSNSVGKTKQATKAKKPYYLGFEAGINAISGIPFARINSWSEFKMICSQLTNVATLDKAKEMYNTIIFDTVDASAKFCEKYVCDQNDAPSIAKGNKGYGLWKEYESEYWFEINRLTNVGYTVIFIGHESSREFQDEHGETYNKIFPKGDKRTIDPIVDLVDVVAFLRPNGLDEHGNEILSSAFFVNTPYFLSRSRFTYMPKKLQEFTLENLESALSEAIEKEEAEKSGSTVSFKDFQETQHPAEATLEELKEKVKECVMKLQSLNRMEEYMEIVSKYLPSGVGVKDAKKTHKEQVKMIVFELEQLDYTHKKEE